MNDSLMMPGPIFDSHAHYDNEQFDPDRGELLASLLPEKSVVGILNVGADLEGCRDTVAMTKKYPYIYGGVGIHPECARNLPEDWLATLEAMSREEKIVAIGEIGLDYHWLEECPRERQQEVFTAQLELARTLSYPVVIHDREAHGDTLRFLQKYRPRGVMHCFSGSPEMGEELIQLGLYLGFGGALTFKNARHAPETVIRTPLDRILLETDAPYMAPVPFRGKRNDSSLILQVAIRIGELKNLPVKQVLEQTNENARRLFHID